MAGRPGSLAAGKVAGVDPEAWKIIDGKLYLSWSKKGSDRFQKNADTQIKKADENWANLGNQN